MKKSLISIFYFALLTGKIFAQPCDAGDFKGPAYYDTYHEYANQPENWAHYNVHDPTVYKDGDYYYMYNTDVALGRDAGSGSMKRRSKNLIDWEYLGKAFDGVPQSAKDFFLEHNPDYTDSGIWAPFLTKHKNEYRLYYSAPGGLEGENLAFIGVAISDSAVGPWEDQGKVTTSTPGDTINAIDPTVVTDQATGQQWMAYGSYQNGIYIVELDTATGKIKEPNDRGHKIAARQGGRHGSIEGPEITYRNGWYYLFVSYDWLEDHYNVRVGRSQNPEGPYFDIHGNNMAEYSDNEPMIQAPYRFNHHEGWQGTAHCAVYQDNGTWYMFNQGRPGLNIYNMVLHVRKMFWINDWPVVSPERYADVPQCDVPQDSITGEWEHLPLIYDKSSQFSTSNTITLEEDGTINGDDANTWNLKDSLLTMNWNNGENQDKMIVSWGWDWENRCATPVYTGLNAGGLAIWGKKINRNAVQKYTDLEDGAVYTIRNHYSNMIMEVAGNKADNGTSIKQAGSTGTENQLWRLLETDDEYYKIQTLAGDSGRVQDVEGTTNGADIRLWTNHGIDRQKFKIIYNDNGYFQMRPKTTEDEKCVDLQNFSVQEGGNIFQWEYQEGVNQMWRFQKVDSIDKDTTTDIVITENNRFTEKILIY